MTKRNAGKTGILGAAALLGFCSLPCCGEHGEREAAVSGSKAGGAATPVVGREVRWNSSLSDAMKIAKEAKKPLMVDFFSERCGWCKVLDQKTYSDPAVRACAEKFVAVKVDVGRDPLAAAPYKVTGLPTILFMNSAGEVVHSVIGFRPAAPFLAEMQKALEKTGAAK